MSKLIVSTINISHSEQTMPEIVITHLPCIPITMNTVNINFERDACHLRYENLTLLCLLKCWNLFKVLSKIRKVLRLEKEKRKKLISKSATLIFLVTANFRRKFLVITNFQRKLYVVHTTFLFLQGKLMCAYEFKKKKIKTSLHYFEYRQPNKIIA